MTGKKRKKVVRLRGSRTHGYGSKKKHRGKGSKGGKGYAGSKKQKKTWILKYERDHYGKSGFHSLRQRGFGTAQKAINIGDLLQREKGDEIDAAKLGYQKVLGGGMVDRKVTVKALKISRNAARKIEGAGGKAIPEAQESAEEKKEEKPAAVKAAS